MKKLHLPLPTVDPRQADDQQAETNSTRWHEIVYCEDQRTETYKNESWNWNWCCWSPWGLFSVCYIFVFDRFKRDNDFFTKFREILTWGQQNAKKWKMENRNFPTNHSLELVDPSLFVFCDSLFKYLMGPYNAGPNFTSAPLTTALITPVLKNPFSAI